MTEKDPAGSSELRLRVVSSLVLGVIALSSAWIGGWFLALVWLGASIAVAYEWLNMARVVPARSVFPVAAVGLAVVQFAWILATAPVFAGALLAAVSAVVLVARPGRDRAWAGLGLLYAVPIALVPVIFRFHHIAGIWALLWVFAVVWATDISAYFVGRTLGGPKLWPAISPKKTWSGFLGGLIGAVAAASALAWFDTEARFGGLDKGTIIVLSGLASVASQGGDLLESALKRHFGVKDSGSLIPGHGGFMDRLDGFAAVALLLCLLLPFTQLPLWFGAPEVAP